MHNEPTLQIGTITHAEAASMGRPHALVIRVIDNGFAHPPTFTQALDWDALLEDIA